MCATTPTPLQRGHLPPFTLKEVFVYHNLPPLSISNYALPTLSFKYGQGPGAVIRLRRRPSRSPALQWLRYCARRESKAAEDRNRRRACASELAPGRSLYVSRAYLESGGGQGINGWYLTVLLQGRKGDQSAGNSMDLRRIEKCALGILDKGTRIDPQAQNHQDGYPQGNRHCRRNC